MKAVRFSRFGGPEVLEIVDLPDPHPGPGQVRIAVRAAGVNPNDWKKRQGLMDGELPQTLGHEAAGVLDELGEGVAGVAAGDRVFGLSAEAAAQAELAVLSYYAPIPPSLDFPGAAALPVAVETATRALDQLGAGSRLALSAGSAPTQSLELGGTARVLPLVLVAATVEAYRQRGGSVSPVAIVARVTVKEGRAGEYVTAFGPLLEQAKQEPGTLLYALHRSKDDPHVFWTTEVYADDAAFAAHSASEVHAAASPVFTELIAAADVLIGETLIATGLGG